jgi:hypothetical protein
MKQYSENIAKIGRSNDEKSIPPFLKLKIRGRFEGEYALGRNKTPVPTNDFKRRRAALVIVALPFPDSKLFARPLCFNNGRVSASSPSSTLSSSSTISSV